MSVDTHHTVDISLIDRFLATAKATIAFAVLPRPRPSTREKCFIDEVRDCECSEWLTLDSVRRGPSVAHQEKSNSIRKFSAQIFTKSAELQKICLVIDTHNGQSIQVGGRGDGYLRGTNIIGPYFCLCGSSPKLSDNTPSRVGRHLQLPAVPTSDP